MRGLARLILGSLAAGAIIGGVARAVVPQAGRMLRVNGRRVQIRDAGSGPAVVMIHGLSGQMQNFARLWPLLRDHRVVTMDRAGAGRSGPAAPHGASLRAQAAGVAAVMEELGTGPAILVGHSLGGAVVLQLAADRPDLVAGVVTLGALTRPVHERLSGATMALATVPPAREVAAYLLTAPLLPVVGPWMLWLSFAPEPMPPGFLRWGGALLATQPRAVAGVMRDIEVVAQGIGALQPRLPGLRMPVTALHGAQDHVLSPDHARHLAAAVPQTDLRIVPGGHMLPVTQPELVAQPIRDLSGG